MNAPRVSESHGINKVCDNSCMTPRASARFAVLGGREQRLRKSKRGNFFHCVALRLVYTAKLNMASVPCIFPVLQHKHSPCHRRSRYWTALASSILLERRELGVPYYVLKTWFAGWTKTIMAHTGIFRFRHGRRLCFLLGRGIGLEGAVKVFISLGLLHLEDEAVRVLDGHWLQFRKFCFAFAQTRSPKANITADSQPQEALTLVWTKLSPKQVHENCALMRMHHHDTFYLLESLASQWNCCEISACFPCTSCHWRKNRQPQVCLLGQNCRP